MRYRPVLPGDHIYINLGIYEHHGIYCGSGKVIHFRDGRICRDSKHRFSHGRRIHVQRYHQCYPRKRVVARAKKRLGQENYNLLFNNCEHFATWCKIGRSRCKQLEKPDKTFSKAVKHVGHRKIKRISRILNSLF